MLRDLAHEPVSDACVAEDIARDAGKHIRRLSQFAYDLRQRGQSAPSCWRQLFNAIEPLQQRHQRRLMRDTCGGQHRPRLLLAESMIGDVSRAQ